MALEQDANSVFDFTGKVCQARRLCPVSFFDKSCTVISAYTSLLFWTDLVISSDPVSPHRLKMMLR